jgi:hypothetical protein
MLRENDKILWGKKNCLLRQPAKGAVVVRFEICSAVCVRLGETERFLFASRGVSVLE